MLNRALDTLTDQEKRDTKSKDNPHTLTIYTDRGGHYRGGRWIEALNGKVSSGRCHAKVKVATMQHAKDSLVA